MSEALNITDRTVTAYLSPTGDRHIYCAEDYPPDAEQLVALGWKPQWLVSEGDLDGIARREVAKALRDFSGHVETATQEWKAIRDDDSEPPHRREMGYARIEAWAPMLIELNERVTAVESGAGS